MYVTIWSAFDFDLLPLSDGWQTTSGLSQNPQTRRLNHSGQVCLIVCGVSVGDVERFVLHRRPHLTRKALLFMLFRLNCFGCGLQTLRQ